MSSEADHEHPSISIEQFVAAIEKLPEDEPRDRDGVWYRSQKEHWLGWLSQYHGPGAYGRRGGDLDAKYAYNHIVNPSKAARIRPEFRPAAIYAP